ncbi:unnamed protein product [Echinostoma caproni]|uniref:Uncharacterized protein n=1 Tax=Echinostoma caproni TaxID=27848 RepID=A0A183AS28_9TREM|nr:unnamed protein product [Echinostoma caproni]
MQDATRSWVLVASGQAALKLLRVSDLSMDQLIEELIVTRSRENVGRTVQSTTPLADRFLRAIRGLKNQWLNVLVRASWRAEWDLCLPVSLNKLQMKFELIEENNACSSTESHV